MNARTLLAQAATWVMTGPVMPYFMEIWQAAIDPKGPDGEGRNLALALGLEDQSAFDYLLEAAAPV